jgi:NAD(P)-dependent dehydrogenase (short-subunit alcohol dehydrogenase family)
VSSQPDSIDLKGQIAVVTGGGRGLGRVFAQALAAAGASVAVIARSANELTETVGLIERTGGRAQAFSADVTAACEAGNAFAEIEQSLGPVDLLINNAGSLGPLGPFWETNVDEWWSSMNVNLRGQLLCARFVLPGMVSRRHERIINVASGGGATVVRGELDIRSYFSSYITSKTALIRFAECLAAETRQYGVATFVMGPGTVRTAMSEYSLNSPAGQKWIPWFRRIFDEGFDLPPERPAKLMLMLASGRADVLAGRFVQPSDDLEDLLTRAVEIESVNLYALGIQKLRAGNQ